METILNIWRTTHLKKEYYHVGTPIYTNGDYRIFQQSSICYLYTYKNIGINQLAGFNKSHLDALAENKRPENEPEGFLYDRAIESIERGKKILTN